MDISRIQGPVTDEFRMPGSRDAFLKHQSFVSGRCWTMVEGGKEDTYYCNHQLLHWVSMVLVWSKWYLHFFRGRILISCQPNCILEVLTVESAGAQRVPIVWLSDFPHVCGVFSMQISSNLPRRRTMDTPSYQACGLATMIFFRWCTHCCAVPPESWEQPVKWPRAPIDDLEIQWAWSFISWLRHNDHKSNSVASSPFGIGPRTTHWKTANHRGNSARHKDQ